MPRMQIYLPDDLYEEVKSRNLPASELLQHAVRAELRRLKLIDMAEEFLKEAIDEFGEPSAEDLAWAQDLAEHLKQRESARSQREDDSRRRRRDGQSDVRAS